MKSPSKGGSRSVRRTPAEIAALLEEHRASGQTVSEFARTRQLPAASVYGWLRVRGECAARAKTAGFAKVVMRGGPVAGVVTLRAAQGWEVEASGLEPDYVASLFKSLLPCSR